MILSMGHGEKRKEERGKERPSQRRRGKGKPGFAIADEMSLSACLQQAGLWPMVGEGINSCNPF